MKSLTFDFRLALSALLCVLAVAVAASAQEEEEAATPWVKVAPSNEAFTVMMPRIAFPVAERGKSGALKAAGQRYSLRHDDAEYTVWSFRAEKLPATLAADTEAYLDRSAEIAWDLMIEPYWEKLKRTSPEELLKYNLTYSGALPSTGHPGRSYRLNLGERQGMTHVYVADSQIYIVAAAGGARESANVQEFIKSFTLNLPLAEAPAAATPTGTGVAPGRGESMSGGGGNGEAKETDYKRTFKASETTQKARILAKPEPSYTEWARRFSVTGTVRVRAVLMASGGVGGVTAVIKLPHGLTQEAVEAARKIKFEPAVKDGRPVSQYVTIEYNFNIY
jgi:TonB family protein